jgi:heavy metal sensor kinase
MKWPIRLRLTAWYVALLAMILLVVGVFLLLALRAGLMQGVNQNLNEDVAELATDLQNGQSFRYATSAMRALPRRTAFAAQLITPDGTVTQSTGDPVGGAPMLDQAQLARAAGGHDRVRVTRRLGPEEERFRVMAKPVTVGGEREVLVVAHSLETVDESITKLALLLLAAIPAAAAAAGVGGWLLAGKALHPVARMTSQAALISADRLHERVAVPPARDELGRLAVTLNAMLDRIERGVAQQQRLVADASHELRTPLAVMRSELDVQLRAPYYHTLPAEVREVLESLSEEIERMGRTLENLLILARIDEGCLELLYAPQRLDRLVGEVTAKLRPMALAKAIDLTVEGDGVEVLADGPRLELVVTNLIDNAIKYTGRGGSVRVRLWRDPAAQTAGLTVSDTGPGIPKEAQPRLFDRFYRADASRSRADGQGGSGLGLAICREIASAHGGRLWVDSEPGAGASFSLAMPLPSPAGNAANAGSTGNGDGEGTGASAASAPSTATAGAD